VRSANALTGGKTQYQIEKEIGIRSASGAKLLKRLTGKHLTCINYHLAGGKAGEIAKAMGMTEAWVSTVLNDPLSQDVIKKRFHILDMELRALGPKAVNVLRNSMDSEDPNIQLSAADKWFRANGFYAPKKDQGENLSAEDLVRQLLSQTAPGETTTLGITVRKSEDVSN
jgi:hypothetical protein